MGNNKKVCPGCSMTIRASENKHGVVEAENKPIVWWHRECFEKQKGVIPKPVTTMSLPRR